MYNNNIGYIAGIGGGGGGGGGGGNYTTLKLIKLDASAGDLVYPLPAIDFSNDYVKIEYKFIKYDSSQNKITIQAPTGVTIKNGNNPTNYVLKNQYDIVIFVASETNVYTRIT